jgi:O-antigen/teichoic acid export membrane protein
LASPADRSVPRSAADDASRGSAIKLGAELLGRLLALATTLLVARVLGVSDFGLFAVLSGIAVLVAELSDLGCRASPSSRWSLVPYPCPRWSGPRPG